MTVHDFIIALVVLTALRVFAPDVCALTRRVLRAGVRIGATELLTEAPEASALLSAVREVSTLLPETREVSAPTTAVWLPVSHRGEG
ncbi:hypothetical protein [Streptomyces sp. bgisy126]|uniref:hypothetical protein n=1 Tax=unclassified Streptomyces TaxID=2593676 RepID=UPI003EBE633A